jgi:conjugal transfer pilus assembly protein TrbC
MEEKKLRVFMMVIVLMSVFHSALAQRWVLVSFSMPKTLLVETLRDCARYKIPAVLNGLHHDSMPETMAKIGELSLEIPELQMQIDPRIFEKFHIQQVPALVVAQGNCFDVMYGNMPLKRSLERVTELGECQAKRGLS